MGKRYILNGALLKKTNTPKSPKPTLIFFSKKYN